MKWGIAALAALVTLSGRGEAQVYESSFIRYQYVIDQSNQITGNGVYAVAVPRFAELQQAGIQTYSEFLDHLFTRAPSLKKNFIVLHHSQSLQLTSPEHPRVLLFDGGVVFAISEHPENRIQRVEMLESDPVTRDLNFREITFGNGAVHFDANPTSCTACHGRPAKPLWDPYDFWPNAFGSSAAFFGGQAERDAYDRLKAGAPRSPLLSRLQLPAELGFDSEEVNGLTYYLSQMNLTRFWQKNIPAAGGDLNGFRYPLLAVIGHCVSRHDSTFEQEKAALLEYFPPNALTGADIARLDQIYADVVKSRAFTKKFQDSLYAGFFSGPSTIDHARLQSEQNAHALFRWVLDMAGINAANLSTSLMANDYLVSTPSNFMLDLSTSMYDMRPAMFAGIKLSRLDAGTNHYGWVTPDCADLKAKSQNANVVPARSSWRPFPAVHPERPVVSRCAKCHTEGHNPRTPKIEFNDTLALARRIRSSDLGDEILNRIEATGETQMPPGNPLSAAEIQAMREFIKALR